METNNVPNLTEIAVKNSAKALKHEKILRMLALIVIIIGIITTLIFLFTITTVDTQQVYYDNQGNIIEDSMYIEKTFNPAGLGIALGTLLISAIIWAFLNVISNISTSLKELKGMKEKE